MYRVNNGDMKRPERGFCIPLLFDPSENDLAVLPGLARRQPHLPPTPQPPPALQTFPCHVGRSGCFLEAVTLRKQMDFVLPPPPRPFHPSGRQKVGVRANESGSAVRDCSGATTISSYCALQGLDDTLYGVTQFAAPGWESLTGGSP